MVTIAAARLLIFVLPKNETVQAAKLTATAKTTKRKSVEYLLFISSIVNSIVV